MATRFSKGDEVRVDAVIPSGPVQAFRMDEDGIVYCLIEWTDASGNTQVRWFKEDDLVAV
jgi:uncharacterized protein YodC (DUF2158 family)